MGLENESKPQKSLAFTLSSLRLDNSAFGTDHACAGAIVCSHFWEVDDVAFCSSLVICQSPPANLVVTFFCFSISFRMVSGLQLFFGVDVRQKKSEEIEE